MKECLCGAACHDNIATKEVCLRQTVGQIVSSLNLTERAHSPTTFLLCRCSLATLRLAYLSAVYDKQLQKSQSFASTLPFSRASRAVELATPFTRHS